MSNYPRFERAIGSAARVDWQIGDALDAETGKGEAKLRDCRAIAKDHGLDFSLGYLNTLRQTARDFDPEHRPGWLTVRNAHGAGRPEVVDAAVEMKRMRCHEEGVPYKHPTQRELTAARKAITAHAKRKTGKKTMPTAKELSRSAQTEPTELRLATLIVRLGVWANDAEFLSRKFIEHLAGHELAAVERDALLADVDRTIEAWQTARSAVEDPLGSQIERYLQSEGV